MKNEQIKVLFNVVFLMRFFGYILCFYKLFSGHEIICSADFGENI